MSIEDLIAHIDGQQKEILPYWKMERALRRLIESGKVQESERGRFFAAHGEETERHFSGLTQEEYDAACGSYHKAMQAYMNTDKNDDSNDRRLVVCRLIFPSTSRLSDEEEYSIDDLVDLLRPAIPKAVDADVVGIEYCGDAADIHIYGSGANAEIDLIYEAIAPVFRAFSANKGSCIIRYYDEGRREVISDKR